MNDFVLFAFFAFHGKQNKFVCSFFRKIYGAPKLLLVLPDLKLYFFFNYSSCIYCWFRGITNPDGPERGLKFFLWSRHSIVCGRSGIYYYCLGYRLLFLPSKRSQTDPWTKRPNTKRKMGEKDQRSKILKNEKKKI